MLSLIKYSSSFLAAGIVAVALFLFMQALVSQPLPTFPDVQYSGMVSLVSLPEPETPPESKPPPPEEVAEPQIAAPVVNLQHNETANLVVPDTFTLGDSAPGTIFGSGGDNTTINIASELLTQFGEDTRQGFIEVTPFATRRPNIPELAWQHQLNGWVLVAFNVSAEGITRNIKILDAHPKGIFEAEVVRAIRQWRYDVSDLIRHGQDVVLTQKIELQWQHYPQNTPYPEP